MLAELCLICQSSPLGDGSRKRLEVLGIRIDDDLMRYSCIIRPPLDDSRSHFVSDRTGILVLACCNQQRSAFIYIHTSKHTERLPRIFICVVLLYFVLFTQSGILHLPFCLILFWFLIASTKLHFLSSLSSRLLTSNIL